MVDLKTQYEKIQAEIDRAVLDVVSSTDYINGPEVRQFQADLEAYLGGGHVIPCANGTDALQIAMMALGLKAGDEVIVPAFLVVGDSDEERARWRELARLQVAFYGSTPNYAFIFEQLEHPGTTAALRDTQAIGTGDPPSLAAWQAHQDRMAARAAGAPPAAPRPPPPPPPRPGPPRAGAGAPPCPAASASPSPAGG